MVTGWEGIIALSLSSMLLSVVVTTDGHSWQFNKCVCYLTVTFVMIWSTCPLSTLLPFSPRLLRSTIGTLRHGDIYLNCVAFATFSTISSPPLSLFPAQPLFHNKINSPSHSYIPSNIQIHSQDGPRQHSVGNGYAVLVCFHRSLYPVHSPNHDRKSTQVASELSERPNSTRFWLLPVPTRFLSVGTIGNQL